MNTLSVYLPQALQSPYHEILRSALSDGIDIHEGSFPTEEYDVLVEGKPSTAMVTNHPRLQSVIVPYAGIPEKTRALLLRFPAIHVYNLHHNARAVAEYTLALLLAAVKRIIPLHNALSRGDWSLRYQPSTSGMLYGRRVLILGYGAIGQNIARLLEPFEVYISAIRKNASSAEKVGPVHIHPLQDLPALLPETDFLIVTLPLTPETKGLISTNEFALLPNRSIVVNVGRGEVIDQHALYAALRSKRIAGAAIDVWYNYPENLEDRWHTSPSDEPFHELDNIIMSPHKAGGLAVDDVERERMLALADLLNAIKQNTPPPAIDLQGGY